MGERESAPVKAVKAVAAACPEAIKTMVEPVDEAMLANTPGGVFTVRWNQRGSATALGQLAREHRLPIIGPHPGHQFRVDGLAQQAQMFNFKPAEPFEPTRWLADGDTVQVGRCTLAVRHCPGHTPGHVVFHRAEAQRAFVGDVLFDGSIGRTDFPGRDHDTLITSITQRLWPMGDETVFFPGHGPNPTLSPSRPFRARVHRKPLSALTFASSTKCSAIIV